MIKTLNNTIKQDRTAYKIPRSVQDVIPIQRIFADGIFQFGTKYSRTLRFSDINYAIASKEDKTAMFLGYSELLNALDSGSTTKLTICNKQVNRQAFEDTVLLPQRGDSLDGFVDEFNGMLEGKISGSSASVEQERFITVSVHKKNVDEARTFFSRVTGEVSSKLSRLNSSSNELDAAERLDVLRGFFRPEEAALPFDLQSAMKRGHNLKDTICPDSLEFHRDYQNQHGSAGNTGGRCSKIAIVHFVNYKKGTQTRGCMKSVMRYVSQLSKTLWDGQPLVSGIGCQPETAFDEFLSTKLLHHKDGGVMFYHMVQSFPKGAGIDPRTAHEAAHRLAGYFDGCEVLVCTHVDREHIHSHCIINSVNFETGRKVHMADEQIQELRIRNDQICEELGLPKFQRNDQRQSRGMSNAEYYTADRGESWKFELMRVIDECMRCAGNREEFLILLRSEGYDATWTDSRKNITYVTPDGRKCRDSKLHIEKYLKENMEAEFGYRTENDNTRNVDAAQKADGRGATAGTQRDGHGAELERDAQNAARSVSAADAAGCGPENAPDKTGSADRIERDAGEYRKIRETGWEPEREVFFQLQGADREYEALPNRDPERYGEAAFEYGAGDAEENPDVRVDLDYGGDLVHGAVRLGRAVEQMTDNAPVRDGTTTPPHIDSKRRKKLKQKKTALGHAEDDHEDWNMEQHL